jgi:hypothetical protein
VQGEDKALTPSTSVLTLNTSRFTGNKGKHMKIKPKKNHPKEISQELKAQKSEEAMIAGILEGSPDAVGVAVIRLACGCRKMAATDKNGEPASKVIIYRDGAESICDQCKKDNGAFARVLSQFIHWDDDTLSQDAKETIQAKVLGSGPSTH